MSFLCFFIKILILQLLIKNFEFPYFIRFLRKKTLRNKTVNLMINYEGNIRYKKTFNFLFLKSIQNLNSTVFDEEPKKNF